MAELLKGAPVVKAMTEALRPRAEALRARGVTPVLALVRVGEREDDIAYERGAVKRCEQCGVEARRFTLPAGAVQEALTERLRSLSADGSVHGILLFRPLPGHMDDAAVCAAIAPEKDVDGVTAASMAALYAGAGEDRDRIFAPCTAEACVALLKHYGTELRGKRAVVVGRSLVIGKPLAMLLLAEDATVTVAHSRSEDLAAVCRDADVLIAAAGRAGLIGAEHVRAGQTVVDVGIHVLPDGTLCGDVRAAEAEPIVRALTPVPGGVGAVTTAVLCKHVIEAASR